MTGLMVSRSLVVSDPIDDGRRPPRLLEPSLDFGVLKPSLDFGVADLTAARVSKGVGVRRADDRAGLSKLSLPLPLANNSMN